MLVLVLGANSDIAHCTAKAFARCRGASFYLASRDLETLRHKARDLAIRYDVNARAIYFDARDFSSHADFYRQLDPKPDGVVLAFGHQGLQSSAQRNFGQAREILETNFLGALSILEIIAADFERREQGFIIAIGSVAGERGRQSNYLYGAAKGALDVYLSGLRNRLNRCNVRVITVLPGFVRTKMTAHMSLPQLLTTEPQNVARDIYRAYLKGHDRIYSPWYWKWMMRLIKLIPETIFKRLHL